MRAAPQRVGRRHAGRLPLLAAGLAALGLQACSWLADDGLPAWLPYAEARRGLAADLADAGASALRYQPDLSPLDAAERVLIRFQTMDGHMHLFVLGAKDLGLIKAYVDPAAVFRGGTWGLDAGGEPVSGNSGGIVLLDAASGAAPVAATAPDNAYLFGAGVMNYVLYQSGSGIQIESAASPSWPSGGGSGIPISSASSDSFTLADFGLAEGAPRMLIQDTTTDKWIALGWATMGDLLASSDLVGGATSTTGWVGPFGPSPLGSRSWLAPDGLVYASRKDNAEGFDLTRIGFDGSSAAIHLDRSQDVAVSISPYSRYWYFYDGERELLVKARPWW